MQGQYNYSDATPNAANSLGSACLASQKQQSLVSDVIEQLSSVIVRLSENTGRLSNMRDRAFGTTQQTCCDEKSCQPIGSLAEIADRIRVLSGICETQCVLINELERVV